MKSQNLLLALLFVSSQSLWACPDTDRVTKVQSMTPEELAQDAKLKVKLGPDQKILGFTVEHMNPCGLYDTLGFRKGDLITKFEDQPLSSPTSVMLFYNALKGDKPVPVTVIRNSEPVVLVLE